MVEGSKISIQRRLLLEKLRGQNYEFRQASDGIQLLFKFLVSYFDLRNPSEPFKAEIHRHLKSFMKILLRYWSKNHRSYLRFSTNHKQWLDGKIEIKNIDLPCMSASTSRANFGRPNKDFDAAGPKTKKRRIETMLNNNSVEELCFAAEQKLRQSGKRDAASMVKTIVTSPRRATKIKKLCQGNSSKPSPYTPDEALALIVSLKLTAAQYNMLRQGALKKGVSIYPSYKRVVEAKKRCYPSPPNIVVDQTAAEVKLQAVVDLTVHRMSTVEEFNILRLCTEKNLSDLTFIVKWGLDGCGSQSRYKQVIPFGTNDSSTLVSSFVPLQLTGLNEKNEKKVIWQNPRTSSTKFCRPIRFRFVKETSDELTAEVTYIKKQISELVPTSLEVGNNTFAVRTEFLETMVDGKVCNVLSHNHSTQSCYLCGATSKEMNKLDLIKLKPCSDERFSWGLSTLHAYIRCMECLLHISYKLKIEKWQARTQQEKDSVASRKKYVVDRFRAETGLMLDTPKQGGGNTNDGNSARRFFQNPALTSTITGLDKNLIERFSVILSVLSSGREINVQAFEKYVTETATQYVKLYNWYPMPVTVHKILLHGPEVFKKFLIPIGQLSEDVQEIRHKEFKKYRKSFSRKNSRVHTNEDILHCLLISSDPVITNMRPMSNKRPTLSDTAKTLLVIPEALNDQSGSEDEASSSD